MKMNKQNWCRIFQYNDEKGQILVTRGYCEKSERDTLKIQYCNDDVVQTANLYFNSAEKAERGFDVITHDQVNTIVDEHIAQTAEINSVINNIGKDI